MITLLEKLVDGADGAYASKQDLRNLEHAMFSWSERKDAYQAVENNEKAIIDRAMILIQSSKTAPDGAMSPGTLNRCRRDMTLALRAYALGMLLQDEEMLKDRFLYWQKNVLQAMGLHHYQGVKFVLESICLELPEAQANLFKPYFKLGQELVMSN
ncbi:phycobilisome protein [Chamaesiphon sp. VAR_69_metabat_338]|uniref:phycobilisome protein n=1 Tax=Chamaesiphon sp. VAR_69_metabat_338 TaxID=2964704 RepID=UPI00286DA378|nr:phycobilisome protein [Chamaesiphon sp. VAR_69_metabat_338]